MASSPAPRPWTVHHPGPLVALEEGLWSIEDGVPGLPGATRRMTIARRADGGLLFFNAIPLPDALLAQVCALGRPAQLLVPNAFHMVFAHAFSQRLGIPVFGPAAALDEVRRRLATAQPHTQLPADPAFTLHTVDGFSTHELVLQVRRDDRVTLVVADLVTNQRHANSLPGLAMRLAGFSGPRPKLPAFVRKRVGRDLPDVAALLRRLADIKGLTRLVPSHGEVEAGDVPGALRAVADALG